MGHRRRPDGVWTQAAGKRRRLQDRCRDVPGAQFVDGTSRPCSTARVAATRRGPMLPATSFRHGRRRHQVFGPTLGNNANGTAPTLFACASRDQSEMGAEERGNSRLGRTVPGACRDCSRTARRSRSGTAIQHDTHQQWTFTRQVKFAPAMEGLDQVHRCTKGVRRPTARSSRCLVVTAGQPEVHDGVRPTPHPEQVHGRQRGETRTA